MKEVMIVAAEASSSLFAQRLLEHWKKTETDLKAFGVGSHAMETLGFERLGKAEEMAVVGIAEVIEHYSDLKNVFNRLVTETLKRKPAVVVLMDYPDFNLMLAKKLHGSGIPVVYYISPQVWAWRKGRVKKIKKYCEKMIVLFPFEVQFYQEANVPVEFLGHPLLDELHSKFEDSQYRKVERNRRGIQDTDIVLGLMPGSRRGEVARHLETQIQVAQHLASEFSNLRVIFLLAPTFDREQFLSLLGNVSFNYLLLQDDPFEMINLTDLILVASGTATLQVALLKKPMVIMYKLKWLTWILAKLIVHGVKFFGIVNLIMEREIIPERLQQNANVEELVRLLRSYIVDEKHRDEVVANLSQIQSKLGNRGATERVAKSLSQYWKRSP